MEYALPVSSNMAVWEIPELAMEVYGWENHRIVNMYVANPVVVSYVCHDWLVVALADERLQLWWGQIPPGVFTGDAFGIPGRFVMGASSQRPVREKSVRIVVYHFLEAIFEL